MTGSAGAKTNTAWRSCLQFALIAVVAKLIFLAADPQIRIFLGDSASYAWTALSGWIPPDRSYSYGFLLRILAVWPHSLVPVLIVQSACGALTACLAAVIAVRYFDASFRTGCAAALLVAIEPLGLVFERFMMTEAVASLILALTTYLALSYLRQRKLLALIFFQLLGILLVSLRLVLLPAMLVAGLALPFLGSTRWRLRLRDAAISAVLMAFLHYSYCSLTGHLSAKEPAYQYSGGSFLLAAWSPAAAPADFYAAGLPPELFAKIALPLGGHSREQQRWLPGGIISVVVEAVGEKAADQTAKKIALNILERDPLAVMRVVISTVFDYFNLPYVTDAMLQDRGGHREVSAEYRKVFRDNFSFEVMPDPDQQSAVTYYYTYALPWYWLLLLSPFLLGFMASRKPERRSIYLFLVLESVVLLAGISAMSCRVSVRYLQPLAMPAVLALLDLSCRKKRESAVLTS
jgi:hypothetical protein